MNDVAGQIHHAAARGYTSKAEVYAQGRPDYPPEIVDWLQKQLGVGAGQTAVDLGAGTGKFTRYLAATGARIIAVEPVKQMREQLAKRLPGIEVLEGTATAIPLPDNSADALTCAQSFHWFATKATLAEFHRVLKPWGKLALVWNRRDESVPWVAQLRDIIAPYQGDTPRFTSKTLSEVFPCDGFGPLHANRFPHPGHTGAPEDVIVNRFRSTSFIAALPPDEEARVVAAIRDLIASTPELAGKDSVTVPYDTVVYWTNRTG
ncbi:methyltransferase domain-containing protein [[Pseudomonas] carboxydohydrogena]|uniref:Methyltransferase domain-containing protein n=1 Tax=Afipia carboxydohydrogena TaxID=290 RepID=A0ABY8BU41_AFICR|nr:class I SAM-dependent methyltransferase [[Pseudomonas] carboxydohydrogena]WEF51827.1 methyltransferase domain-containing protein [[Pseudomonas] carboxydohydrogena]